MADKTNLVHVQAASGRWVWIPTDKLEEWSAFQDKIRAGWDPEEDPEYKAQLEEKLRKLSDIREAHRQNTES